MSRCVLLLLALVLTAGCATMGGGGGGEAETRFHELWEAGDYEAALAVYGRDSTLRRDRRVLYRTALARLQPGEDFFRPDSARSSLERLLELDAGGERAPEARALLSLLERRDELRAALAEVRRQLERLKAIDMGQPPDTSSR